MNNLHIVKHPLIQDSLSHLRNRETGIQKFRRHSDKLTQLLVAESFRDLSLTVTELETPLSQTTAEKLNDKKYIVPNLGDYGDRYFGTE